MGSQTPRGGGIFDRLPNEEDCVESRFVSSFAMRIMMYLVS